MIQHVYERTACVDTVDRVLVATDDERISEAVRSFGGEAVMTGRHHESGTDRIAEVATLLDAPVVVNVQGDIPFLDPEMLAAGVKPLLDDADLPMATIKTVIRSRDELENPNVVKVVTDRAGHALYFSRYPIPYWRDGNAPERTTFRHIGLYAYRRDFLLHFASLAPSPLERAEKLEQLRALEWGFRIKVAEVREASIEVDTPEDLERARDLVARVSHDEKRGR